MSNVTFSEVSLLYEVGYEAIILCIIGTFVWILVGIFLYRAHLHFKKRRRGLAKFHEQPYDDDEETTATTKYMISFFTSSPHGSFKQAPTGKVVVHLLGSIFPGKIHELQASKPEDEAQLFSPLSCEKFLVTEDVRLGRLIGITLRTNVDGPRPFWNCSTTIVRDVKTNEAWLFRVNSEVSFPPRLILPATQEELCAFKFSFYRRLRREIRNGQFGYFSFLFKSKMAVFTISQRWVTSIGLYCLFSVTCFLFLDFVFSPAHSTGDPTRYGTGVHGWLNPTPVRPKPGNPSIKVLYGESAASYWILHTLIPALISASSTSIIGFFMISFFRQASKFEKHFDEMDYVIGTALMEQNRNTESLKIKAQAILPQFSDVSAKTSFTTQIEASIGSSKDSSTTTSVETFYPVEHEKEAEEKSIYKLIGYLGAITKKTLILMKFKRKSTDKSQHQVQQQPDFNELTPIYPRRSIIFEPGEKPWEFLEPELSPFQKRQIMRRLFLGMDERTGILRRPSGSLGNLRLNSQNFMTFNIVDPEGGKTKKAPKYDLAYLKPERKWYQPIAAWIVLLLIIILSVAFLTVVLIKGKFHKRASEDQFATTFLSTLVIGILVGIFILEPFKIIIVAIWEAFKDKKIYKRIQKITAIRDSSSNEK